jgi:hypothetical protein
MAPVGKLCRTSNVRCLDRHCWSTRSTQPSGSSQAFTGEREPYRCGVSTSRQRASARIARTLAANSALACFRLSV